MIKDILLRFFDVIAGLWGVGVGLPYLLQFPIRMVLVNLLHVMSDFTISVNPTPLIPVLCLLFFLYRRRNVGMKIARRFLA